jgi:hypothetical protein
MCNNPGRKLTRITHNRLSEQAMAHKHLESDALLDTLKKIK